MVQPHGYVIAPVGLGVGFAASTPSGGVNFRVDPDNAEQFIMDMEEVLTKLLDIDQESRELKVLPPGNENFSRDAATTLNMVTTEGPQAHSVANEKARAAVLGMVQNLKQNLQQYRGVEQENANMLQVRGQ